MNEVIAIQDVLTYSSSFVFEESTLFNSPENRNLIIAFIYVVISAIFILEALKNSLIDVVLTSIAIVVGIALGASVMLDMLSVEGREHFKSEEAKWEEELAIPYLDSLPLKAVTNIETISYNRNLRERDKGLSEGDVPVTIETSTGTKYNLWVTVEQIPKESPTPLLTYRYLKEDLKFHDRSSESFEKGYYDITLYTNKPIKGMKE